VSIGCAGILAGCLMGFAAAPSYADQPQVRIGTAPVLPAGTTLEAGIASVRTLRLAIALAPRDADALELYAEAVSEPGSSSFHRYLTTKQFRRRYAPPAAAVRAVERSLRREGLRVGRLSANGLSIHVSGSGGTIEHAFSLALASVRLPDGRDALVNTEAPAVDAAIAPTVQAIIGLDGAPQMQALSVSRPSPAGGGGASIGVRAARTSSAHVATGGPQPCARAVQTAPGQGAYTADQIASAYGFSGVYASGDFGQGVTIAAYELEPDEPSDIAAYQRCYGIHTKISYVKVDGGPGKGPGQGEAALDIEQLVGLAPEAKIIVYQGPNNNADNPGTGPYDTLSEIVAQDRAQVISNSWGECEKMEGATDAHAESTLLEEAAVQGQTFVSASGDTGSEDCWSPPPGGDNDNALAVDDPGSQPFSTSVGGTSLTALGPPPTETVWNDDNPAVDYAREGIEPGAGGGGISSFWPMPVYQSGAAASLGVVSPTSSSAPCLAPGGGDCREVPDVSADADPLTAYLDYWNGQGIKSNAESGWQGTGGTSGAAPVWAAIFALADASSACGGQVIGFANGELYSLASESYSTYFNDVTSGNNDFTPSGNTAGLYASAVGYDLASGLGTPEASALVTGLCEQAVHVTDPGTIHSFYGQSASLDLAATLPAGQTGQVRFHARYLPDGLHLDAATGVVSGRVATAGVRHVVVSASSPSGTYGSVRFDWVVQRRPQLAVALGGTPKALALTIRSGAYEPGIRSVTITLPAGIRLYRHGAVRVLNPLGRSVAHASERSGQTLTLKLNSSRSVLVVELQRSALALPGRPSGTLTVDVTDNAGAVSTLYRRL